MPYASCWFLWRAYYIEDFKRRLHFQFGVCILKKGCFERGIIFWRPPYTTSHNPVISTRLMGSYSCRYKWYMRSLFSFLFFFKGQIAFEGHWRLQSWTLICRPGTCVKLLPNFLCYILVTRVIIRAGSGTNYEEETLSAGFNFTCLPVCMLPCGAVK